MYRLGADPKEILALPRSKIMPVLVMKSAPKKGGVPQCLTYKKNPTTGKI
jgi:hypothetical protein